MIGLRETVPHPILATHRRDWVDFGRAGTASTAKATQSWILARSQSALDSGGRDRTADTVSQEGYSMRHIHALERPATSSG
jgi:hypothetical protein